MIPMIVLVEVTSSARIRVLSREAARNAATTSRWRVKSAAGAWFAP